MNLRSFKLLNESICKQFLKAINDNVTNMPAKSLSISLKMLSEIPTFRNELYTGVDWSRVEKNFVEAMNINNDMQLLSNIAYLEEYLSKRFHEKFVSKTANRARNEA